MKMTKKLIPISVILVLAVMFGLVGAANAAYDEVTFSNDTLIGIQDLKVSSGSKVKSIAVGDTTISITLESGSTITFTSATGQIMQISPAIGSGNVCDASDDASLTIIYDVANPVVVLSLTGGDCADSSLLPTVSTVVVASTTTVTVTMSEKIDYVSGKTSADLLDGTAKFAGHTPSAVSTIDGTLTSFTFTFAAALTGVKDDSVLLLPSGVLTNGSSNLAEVTDQVVTTLSSINQLYDFVFMIQQGQNFISVPYDVTTTVGNSYVDPSPTSITIFTILDATGAGSFTGVSSSAVFEPLDGYYINSTGSDDVYLRLKKTAAVSQTLIFERTLSATGWHIIGVASNNVSDCIGAAAGLGDTAVLSSLAGTSNLIPDYYDRVVDIAVGKSTDHNDTSTPDETYDVSVYKGLLNDAYIRAQTKAQIDDTTPYGIEFNHGEAYFIYITLGNAKYIGEKVNDANLVL